MNGVKVKLDPDSYKAGYQAGYNREKPAAPASCDDLGWYSGYIEGKADRYHGRRNRMEPVPAELEGSSCYPGTVNGTLTAGCPYCGRLDAYTCSGEHAVHGRDQVYCSGCGREFLIQW